MLHSASATALATLAGIVALAVWIAGRADPLLGEHDSGKIVIDEVAGMIVALAGSAPNAAAIALAFALFRVLDVTKPWPAGEIDRNLPGGPGVVLDDVVSGIYANALVRVLLFVTAGAAG